MKSSWSKIERIVYTFVALIIGYVVVFCISNLGDHAKGPFSVLAYELQNVVHDVECNMILRAKSDSRKSHLEWFKDIGDDSKSLLNNKGILLGASDGSTKNSYETIFTLEDSLKTVFPLIHIYSAWGDKSDQQFPMLEVKAISDLGSVPVITWEPWLSDFENQPTALLTEGNNAVENMLEIVKGNYDTYIHNWAKMAKKYGKPIYLRWGHEMNDPTRYPWGARYNLAENYVAAWKHVHDVFKAEQATNIIWVWSPHLSYTPISLYYPGDDYVDMVGCTVLNYGNTVSWSDWWSFNELFGIHYDEISAFNKPIMIAEFGSANEGGDRSVWFDDAINQVYNHYRNVKVLLFFNYSSDKTISDLPLNWNINQDEKSLSNIRNVIHAK